MKNRDELLSENDLAAAGLKAFKWGVLDHTKPFKHEVIWLRVTPQRFELRLRETGELVEVLDTSGDYPRFVRE